jgi:hypothetical protein
MGEIRYVHRILSGKPEEKKSLQKFVVYSKLLVHGDIKLIGFVVFGQYWFDLGSVEYEQRFFVNPIMNLMLL